MTSGRTGPHPLEDERLRAKLIADTETGVSIDHVADASMVPRSTLRSWIRRGREIIEALPEDECRLTAASILAAISSADDLLEATFSAEFMRARAEAVIGAAKAIKSEISAPSDDSRDRVHAAIMWLSIAAPANYSRAAQARAALETGGGDGDEAAAYCGLAPDVADAILAAARDARKRKGLAATG